MFRLSAAAGRLLYQSRYLVPGLAVFAEKRRKAEIHQRFVSGETFFGLVINHYFCGTKK